jgi:hypothetical protein
MTEKKLGETYAEFAERHDLKDGEKVRDIAGNNWLFTHEPGDFGFGFRFGVDSEVDDGYGRYVIIIPTHVNQTGTVLPHSFVDPVSKPKLKKIVLKEWFYLATDGAFWGLDGFGSDYIVAVCDENGVQNTREIWVKE